MEPIYWEQYRRAKRWYVRLQKINSGQVHNMETDNYQDEVYGFFTACYHLKDWIKHDPATTVTVDVEAYINSKECLKLAADICNGSKHLKLDRPRSESGSRISGRDISLTIGPEEPVISIKYFIASGRNKYEAFQIATECMQAWTEFLCSYDRNFKTAHEAGNV